MKIVLVTGGFDPLHSGHIEYFKAAKRLGSILIVGVNSDAWLDRKKGRAFMPFTERVNIIRNLDMVDLAFGFDDQDNTAIKFIEDMRKIYPVDKIVFANGGDRSRDNIPEMVFDDIDFVFGVGGTDKKNSSSWILEEWKAPKTKRHWGYYRVLHEVPGVKVKELTIEPGQTLSMQRHFLRSEYWLVSEGKCLVNFLLSDSGYKLPSTELSIHRSCKIPVGEWHQLVNPYDAPCRIVEIQYGEECEESDIERRL